MRTVSRLSRWLCIPVLLPLWPAAGQKPGELYVSPLKNFSIAVPKFAFGTRVQKSNNRDGGLVVFIGGLGDLERVDYARLTGGRSGEHTSGLQALTKLLFRLLLEKKKVTRGAKLCDDLRFLSSQIDSH